MAKVSVIDELELGEFLKGAILRNLAAMDITTVGQLLRHYPRRYHVRGQLTNIGDLRVGMEATVISKVREVSVRPGPKTIVVSVLIGDETGEAKLAFFARQGHIAKYLASKLSRGTVALFAGTVKESWNGRGPLEFSHPDWEALPEWESVEQAEAASDQVIPIYPATAKLRSWKIKDAIRQVLAEIEPEWVPDPITEKVRRRVELPSEFQALQMVHHPESLEQAQLARRRLKFTEAFSLQVALMRRRFDRENFPAFPIPLRPGPIYSTLQESLPFELTPDQVAAQAEISRDIAREVPMVRLLQGDVGSGKTVVGLLAMARVLDAGLQAAILAPTEVLAQQHARTFRSLLANTPPVQSTSWVGLPDTYGRDAVALLTASTSAAARREILADLAAGIPRIVVGTHALIQDDVEFTRLALAVVDEQQRFGVAQRDQLTIGYQQVPHTLFMTATPIPRSLVLAYFGDFAVSQIRHRPQGRPPVSTHVVALENEKWRERMFARAAEHVKQGGRLYVVVPRVGNGDAAEGEDEILRYPPLKFVDDPTFTPWPPPEPATQVIDEIPSIASTVALLERRAEFAGVKIETLYGAMPSDEKTAAMAEFAAGRSPVLVATSVIEVGVDVPEADVMIILGAEFFGLSQLHQLRGRIGRGSRPGICFLAALPHASEQVLERLEKVAQTHDGFQIAESDLEYRRGGDILGTDQHGLSRSLKILTLPGDGDVVELARNSAIDLLRRDPTLERYTHVHEALAQLRTQEDEENLNRF